MVEVTKEARQRCADLSNEVRKERGNSPAFYAANCFGGGDMAESVAFARHVQQTSDTMREIVGYIGKIPPGHEALNCIEALARPFILPEPEVDPLVEAIKEIRFSRTARTEENVAADIRAHLAKSGKVIKIVEAE